MDNKWMIDCLRDETASQHTIVEWEFAHFAPMTERRRNLKEYIFKWRTGRNVFRSKESKKERKKKNVWMKKHR
jgi:hypothetical protein